MKHHHSSCRFSIALGKMLLLAHSSWKTYTKYPNKRSVPSSQVNLFDCQEKKVCFDCERQCKLFTMNNIAKDSRMHTRCHMMPLAPLKLVRNLKIYQKCPVVLCLSFYELNGAYKMHWIGTKKYGFILPYFLPVLLT